MRRARGAPSGHRFVILRALLRQRRRLVLAGVSIALGVGYLAGTLGLLGRIGSGLDELAIVSADDAEVVIEGSVAYESPLEKVRRLVPAELAQAVSSVQGVESASHRVEGTALVLGPQGAPVASLGLSEQPLLTNWPEDPEVSNLEITEGRGPETGDEVVLDSRSAEVAGVGIGDQVRVAGRAGFGDYEVVGVVDSGSAGRAEGSSLVMMTTDEARLVLDQPIDDNRIAVRISDGADVGAVMSQIASMVPSGVEVTDGPTAAIHTQESLTRSFTLVRVLVTGFGVLALLVGMVTVGNSLALLHSQRRRTFAGFRLVGASRAQLRRAALGEAVILALVSSLVGLPLGLLSAVLIEKALGTMGTAVPTAGPLLSVQAAAVAVGIGLAATLVAAWRPVRNACSAAPIEAVSETEPASSHRWPVPAVAASRAAILAVAAAAVCVIAGVAVPTTAVVAGIVLAGVFVLGLVPTILTLGVAAAMRVLPIRPKPLRVVAARDARRNPRRTAATTAAVLVAVLVVSALAVFLQSFTASLDEAVDGLVNADLVVDSETFTRGGLPAELVQQLDFVEGVDGASGWQLGRGGIGGTPVRMTGLDGDAATQVVSPEFVGEQPEGLPTGSAWISQRLASQTGLGVGDVAPVDFYSGGFEQLTISGVYRGSSAILGDLVTDRQVLMRQVPATQDLAALVKTDGNPQTVQQVEELASSYGVTAVTSPDEFVGDRGEILRGFERVVVWMLLFTLLQALVGVINTLVLSVGERRREFGLLRVAGSSRRSLLRMVLLEGVSFSSVGTLLGIAGGTAAAAGAVWVLGSLGLGVFSIPVASVAAVAVVAVFAGVLASLIPATMASRVPPLEALADTGAEFKRVARPAVPTPTVQPAPTVRPAPTVQPAPLTSPLPGLGPLSAPTAPGRPTPATAGPVAPVARTVPRPPPFDPSRLPAPVAAALQAPPGVGAQLDVGAPLQTEQILSVAVLDGASVTTLAADSNEALALLALYGLLEDGPQVLDTAPRTRHAGEVALDPAATAIAVLLSDAFYDTGDAAGPATTPAAGQAPPFAPEGDGSESPVSEPAVSEPAVSEPAVSEPAVSEPPPYRPASDEPTPQEPTPQEPTAPVPFAPEPAAASVPPFGAVPEPAHAQRRGLRRSKRKDPADRRPPRRVRRGPLPTAAEGWVDPSPQTDGLSGTGAAPTSAEAAARRSAERIPSSRGGGLAPEQRDLSSAVRRLDAHTQQRWSAVLHSMNAALANGEQVDSLVCGRVQAAPAAVSRTDRRLLVVAQRPGRLAVESLHPVATEVVVRPGPAGTVVVVLVDRGRSLEVTDVTDTAAAESLVLRDVTQR